MLTPNGASVRSRTSLTARRSSSSDIVAAARMPRPPAADVAAASWGGATQPMPVCTIGEAMPNSPVSRVGSAAGAGAESIAEYRPSMAEIWRLSSSGIGDFVEPVAGRVDLLEEAQLGVGRLP